MLFIIILFLNMCFSISLLLLLHGNLLLVTNSHISLWCNINIPNNRNNTVTTLVWQEAPEVALGSAPEAPSAPAPAEAPVAQACPWSNGRCYARLFGNTLENTRTILYWGGFISLEGWGEEISWMFLDFCCFPFPKAVALPFLKELFTWQIWRHDRDTASRLA